VLWEGTFAEAVKVSPATDAQYGGHMETTRIETFDDWKDIFQSWQKDINYDTQLFSSVLQGYEFTERFSESKHREIGFGEFSGAASGAIPAKFRDLKSKICCSS
jgi:hypothetical protein